MGCDHRYLNISGLATVPPGHDEIGPSWTDNLDEPTILEADLRGRAVNVAGVNPLCSRDVRRDARVAMGWTEDPWHGAHTAVAGVIPALSAVSLTENINNLSSTI